MAFVRCSFAVAVAALALSGAAARRTASDAALFEQFKRKYNKVYADPTEEVHCFATFCANARRAEKLSAANPHASFSVLTPFADIAENEFAPRHSGAMAIDDIAHSTAAPSRPEVARSALVVGARDWRRHGAVTSVKDQGKCGACWAFATAGSIEGQWAVAGHNVTSLSAQELVSCDYTNHGCAAGYITKALDYIGFKFIPRNETEMVAFVAHSGPLAVIIDASTLQSYHGGVVTNCPDGAVGHAVLVVGFDLNAAVPYWIVKNSWGPAWGEAGYFRLQYGTDQCSITSNPTTALVPPRSGNAPPSLPPPPPPPATPVPTPVPSLRQAQYRELRCPDSTCSGRCEITTYEQGAAGCVSYGAGYSADYVCVPGGMQERVYSGLTCGGTPVATSKRATNECVMNNNGVHLMGGLADARPCRTVDADTGLAGDLCPEHSASPHTHADVAEHRVVHGAAVQRHQVQPELLVVHVPRRDLRPRRGQCERDGAVRAAVPDAVPLGGLGVQRRAELHWQDAAGSVPHQRAAVMDDPVLST